MLLACRVAVKSEETAGGVGVFRKEEFDLKAGGWEMFFNGGADGARALKDGDADEKKESLEWERLEEGKRDSDLKRLTAAKLKSLKTTP